MNCPSARFVADNNRAKQNITVNGRKTLFIPSYSFEVRIRMHTAVERLLSVGAIIFVGAGFSRLTKRGAKGKRLIYISVAINLQF